MDVLSTGSSACRVCAGPTRSGFALCFCCTALVHRLQMPLAPLTAVASYQVGDPVHRLLRGYKDAPAPETRRWCCARLARMVEEWLAAGGDRLLAREVGPWDVVVTVPSSRRPSGSPVDRIVSMVPALAGCHRPWLVRGPVRTDHLEPSRHGFALAPGIARSTVSGRRALVVDDTVVTGARAQSAVAALRAAGARVSGVLVVGRVVGRVEGSTGMDRCRQPNGTRGALRVGKDL